jgi:hypothetical protein
MHRVAVFPRGRSGFACKRLFYVKSAVGVWWRCAVSARRHEDLAMSKGLDRKREAKKKPQKSLAEKRAAKREKKQNRGF